MQGCSVRSTCRLRAGGEAERVLHRSCSHIQREERGADDAGGQVLVCWSVVSTCRENGNNCSFISSLKKNISMSYKMSLVCMKDVLLSYCLTVLMFALVCGV